MMLVFMLEELSMKVFLEGLLPRILPEGVSFTLIPHQGKSDLEKSLPRKLRGWKAPDSYFVVVRDQDSGDCYKIKSRLRQICVEAGRPEVLIRIACRELEAWFIGDLAAVGRAFCAGGLADQQKKRKYRTPDTLGSPSRELETLVKGYGKVKGARKLGPLIDMENKRSTSFAAFISGVQGLAAHVVSS